MMKKIYRILIVLVCVVSLFTVLTVKAADGYMYSSDGKLIECSVGYTVTSDGIYSVLNESWQKLGGDVTVFNSPADMCLYEDPETGEQTLYVVDSGKSCLLVFDKDINFIGGGELKEGSTTPQPIKDFVVDPEKFKNADGNYSNELLTMNTAGAVAKTTTLLWTRDAVTAYTEEGTKPRIECCELSGVWRAKRPFKINGINVIDDLGEPIYQDIIYLCDKTNKQVVLVSANGFDYDYLDENNNPANIHYDQYEVMQVVSAPTDVDKQITDKFFPVKMVTDVTGRMYVICDGIYEGILLMSYNGDFMRMVGVNYTTLSVWDAIKRNFKTEEQLKQETQILNTTFNNITIDEKGFLYTVSDAIKNANGTYNTSAMIKKINQANTDVLKRNGYSAPIGDLITIKTGANAGTSRFVAIDINTYGVYTVADAKQNRLFTYDAEGNLLYISGGSGNQVTDIGNCVAIAYQGDFILVLDAKNKCIMRFEPTDFARKINKAVEYEYLGDAESAADQWQNVINLNPAYELAYVGVGKKLYSEGRYQEAMLQFKKGADVNYYSRAYKKYRDDIIKKYFPAALTILLVLIVAGIVVKIIKKRKNKKPYEDGELL